MRQLEIGRLLQDYIVFEVRRERPQAMLNLLCMGEVARKD